MTNLPIQSGAMEVTLRRLKPKANADVAQPAEQVIRNDSDAGSTPVISSTVCRHCTKPITEEKSQATGWIHVSNQDWIECQVLAEPLETITIADAKLAKQGFNDKQRNLMTIIVYHRVKMEENTIYANLRQQESMKLTTTHKEAMKTLQDGIAKGKAQHKYHAEQMVKAENDLRMEILNGVTVGQELPEETTPEPEPQEQEQIGRAE